MPRLPTDFSKPIHINLPISHAGAFTYWVEYDGDEAGTRVKGREGYFNNHSMSSSTDITR